MITISKHDRAVEKLLNRHYQTHNVKEALADLPGKKTPAKISGEIPDIFLKFQNGKEKIIEVDTRPRTPHDKKQHRTFKRSAAAKPSVRSYEHYFASKVL